MVFGDCDALASVHSLSSSSSSAPTENPATVFAAGGAALPFESFFWRTSASRCAASSASWWPDPLRLWSERFDELRLMFVLELTLGRMTWELLRFMGPVGGLAVGLWALDDLE